MDGVAIGLIGLGATVVLLALRLPIGVALGGVAFLGIWAFAGPRAAWGMLSQVPYEFTAHWTLSSIPMFLLMGYVSYHARITESLFSAAQLWLGRLPGGLGIATVAGAAGFSAVTGSSLAAAAAMGRIAVPEMARNGYRPGFAAGIVAAAGTIGSMIPPSIIMILYGIFAEVSIGKLFIAGIFPGLLTALIYSLAILIRVLTRPEIAPRTTGTVPMSAKLRALGDAWPFLLLVLGVFGGLFSGAFTPTEAGAVGALLSIVIAAAKGALTRKVLGDAVTETLHGAASIFFIAVGAALLTRFLAFTGVPTFFSDMIVAAELDQLQLMLAIALLYIFLGMFLDPMGCLLLTLPILLPILEARDADLIWFGILLVKFLEIGLITPPVGLNVYVIKEIMGDQTTVGRIFQGVSWFIVADILLVTAMIVLPGIVTYLPRFIE
ncbi:TRAP transporter large permease subunit [uncultured Albimonas sp.]|uniref:TRAP transporter large permease n=1 Tax=uncultured Albimonas sp. TaxID=1331701 RepID=UPI0030ECEEE0|tara:strand:- start:432 stop:1739 length:1308 start_codon:yes stop_codon:yes gene_type:complete